MNNSKVHRIARRRFLATAAAAAAITIVPRHVLGGAKFIAPSEKVNIALIGAGGQGRTNARALFHEPDCQVIAIADPCREMDLSRFYYGGQAGLGPVKEEVEKHYAEKSPNYRCAEYQDYRQMLQKEKSIDAVLIATPDHLHAHASVMAMKLGKHVYCEKPLAHSLWETRLVARVARETGVATQMGNQGNSAEGLRACCEWIWDGAIGKVRQVHGWTGAGRFVPHRGRPTDTPPVPEGLNWDLWLGPRAHRPYHPSYTPFSWRGYWDFGTGAFGDMACHNIDQAVVALKLEHPLTVEADPAFVDPEVTSPSNTFTYQFPARGEMPAVTLIWHDGGRKPPTPPELDPEDSQQRLGDGGNGILFIGEKGYITCAGWAGMPRLLPLDLHRSYKRPEKTLPRVKGHHADWLQACKGGRPASSNFEAAARLTEIILIGNVALRSGKKLEWDGPNLRARNAPEAEQFIRGQYRKGWEIQA
jgi:predicted dehydrogenase